MCTECHELNLNVEAARCKNCAGLRKSLGAVQSRLALWCTTCSTADERMHELCRECFNASRSSCGHCSLNATGSTFEYTCTASNCSVSFRLCLQCRAVFSSSDHMLCQHCWHQKGMMCVSCGSKAQHLSISYRRCRPCQNNFFCGVCVAPPPPGTVIRKCSMCEHAALWCAQHCSVDELESGLCRRHFKELQPICFFCFEVRGCASNYGHTAT